MIDKNKFYRDVSWPLCKYMDLEKAIHGCIKSLGNYMAADGMAIMLLEPQLKSSRSVIWNVSAEMGIKAMDSFVLPMPLETRRLLKESPLPDLRIINRPELDPVSEYFMEVTGNDCSMLAMFVYKNNKRFGVVILSAVGRDRYSEDELNLFALVREPITLALNNYLQVQENTKLQQMLADTFHKEEQGTHVEDIIGHNLGLRNAIEMVQLVAPMTSPVLVTGETGVGKELIASAIHSTSPRRDGPLIRVNCGAIPESVVDSELFGHEKGAFTGAISQRLGRFERADGGTIFLDEIGELKPDVQVKLLRVLQNGEVERVGGSQLIQVDVRIVAATHRNLEILVGEGRFREDLLFRINVFPIVIPPLRARKKDIPALVDHFIRKKSRELSVYPPPALGDKAIDKLMGYDWPGNVRELENVVERELILNRKGPLLFHNFNTMDIQRQIPAQFSLENECLVLNDLVATHICQVLEMTKGRISGAMGAAQVLGLHPNTLRNKMTKLGIPFRKKNG
jgi:hydrogenase-4 transcriptional activator